MYLSTLALAAFAATAYSAVLPLPVTTTAGIPSTATTTPTIKESSLAPGFTVYEPKLTAPPLPTNVKPLSDWETTWKALGGVLHPGSLNDDDFERIYDALAHDGAERLDHLADRLAGRDMFKGGDHADLKLTKEVLEGLRDGTIMLPVIKEDDGKKPGFLVMPLHKGDKGEKLAGRDTFKPGDLADPEYFKKLVEALRDGEMPLTEKFMEWLRERMLHTPIIKEDKVKEPGDLVVTLHKEDKEGLPVDSLSIPLHRGGKDEPPIDRLTIPVHKDDQGKESAQAGHM